MYDPAVTTAQSSVTTPCMCALDGDNGFCGSVLGTETYTKAVASLRPILTGSQCHTLDRNDLRAQKDVCGVGQDLLWSEAV